MGKTLNKDQKEALQKSNPHWNYWTYRKIIRVRMKDAWYVKGGLVKIKWFGTFGCFDYKDRWIDYYDVGKELKPKWFWSIIFFLTKWYHG